MTQNQRWFEVHGDETLALDWKIDSKALVWEIGGYEGRWAAQIIEKFDPFMEIFEPQEWAFDKLVTRFTGNEKVKIHPFGLWVTRMNLPLYNYETDGATLVGEGIRVGVSKFVDIHACVPENVDLCLMNVEGAEFVLIPYLMGLGLMKRFRYFWCQFHPGWVKNGDEKSNIIYKGMLKTHYKMWDCYPTAVAWERQ